LAAQHYAADAVFIETVILTAATRRIADRMSDLRYAVGVDVGETKIDAAVIDSEGKIHKKTKLVTERQDREESVAQVAQAANDVVAMTGIRWEQMEAVGVAVPGISYAQSGKVWAANLPGWDHIPLREWLKPRLP